MDPVAFTLFGLEIRWYGIILTSAMVVAVFFSMRSGRKQGFVEDHFLDIAMFALPAAILCARLYYVLFNLPSYDSLWEMLDIRQGGLAIHGGLLGGVLVGMLVAKRKGMNVIKAADVVAPFIALAQSIGRWGNYVNQEAYGRETTLPWAITIDGMQVHPTFLYESLWDFTVFVLLLKMTGKKKFDGQIAAYYLILYSVGRFFIESLRTDSLMIAGMRTAQIASLLMIALGVVMILLLRKKGIGEAYPKKADA